MESSPNVTEKYHLHKGLTDSVLCKNGFGRNGVYKCFIYKDIIQLIINIDLEDNWWDIQVYNVNTQSIYAPYYNRTYGKHSEVKKLDRKIKLVLDELVKNKILIVNKE